ncbi:hypothetical protein [Neptunomonas phycophila]
MQTIQQQIDEVQQLIADCENEAQMEELNFQLEELFRQQEQS